MSVRLPVCLSVCLPTCSTSNCCFSSFPAGRQSLSRPKSFVATRLLSLEEAQARTQAPLLLQGASFQHDQYHTVLDLPSDRRKRGFKARKAAGGSWKTFFAIGKPTGAGRRKPMRISSLFQPTTSHAGCHVDSVTLRSAKSEESLSSQHSGAGQSKPQRLRRPRSSSDGLSLAASLDPQLLPPPPPSRLPSSRSYDSLLPDEKRCGEDDEDGDDEDEEEEEEGVYMLPDFSNQEPASAWMAEDVIDFSPTFLEDGPVGLVGNRDSSPTAKPPAYRCLSHHGQSSSSSQRPLTEDPDSVLNQSDAIARRSLILAATAPPQQVFCQHRPSNSSPAQAAPTQSPSHGLAPAPERRSFTKKVVHALSQKAPKSPPLDISQPIAISVPAKVLDMIGGRAGESQPVAPSNSAPPPQMISMLLRSCDFQLSDSCQQEIRSKLGSASSSTPGPTTGPETKIRGIPGPTGAPLPPQQPPPPPPKNPARLMALALAESANRALRHQGASPPYRPPQSRVQQAAPPADPRYQRSLSADAGELLASDPNQLYSTVRPLSVWMNPGTTAPNTDSQHNSQADKSQDTEPLSSNTSVSDPSDLSGGNSSGDDHTPSPVYTNQSQNSKPSPSQSQPHRKPPAYSRQSSAPHLQQKSTGTTTSTQPSSTQVQAQPTPNQPQPQPQLQHSTSEGSPLSQVRSFQPSRPRVPPKPLDLMAPDPHRDKEPQRPLLAKSELQRSLDSGRIRRVLGAQTSNAPLARAFSERLSGAPDRLARYHAARAASQPVSGVPPSLAQAGPSSLPTTQLPRQANIRPMPPSFSEDQGKTENFYYEIAGPEPPTAHGPPSYARHSYLNMKLDLEGNFRHSPQHPQPPVDPGGRPLSRSYHGVARGPKLWSSEATRAWAAAHSSHASQSFSHGHAHQRSQGNRPRPQRQTSSSVRLAHSEVHPLPSSSFAPLRWRGPEPPPAPLHPYFENGRVCYHAQPPPPQPGQSLPTQPIDNQLFSPQYDRQASKEQSEPVYVNYPYASTSLPPPHWATSDLDPPSDSDPLSPLGESRSPDASASDDPPSYREPALDTDGEQPPPGAPTGARVHHRSRSDPQSSSSLREEGTEGEEDRTEGRGEAGQTLSGRDIASLLMDKLTEEETRDPGATLTSSSSASSSSSPHTQPPRHHNHPPNPYAPQPPPPAYGLHRGPFQRQEPLRRSSSGGQYRQAFDVMPSGDQVLRFHRASDPGAPQERNNPYPPRQAYQEPPYPQPHPSTPPSAALGALSLRGPRGYHYPITPRRDLVPDPPPMPTALQNQRGLARQGSLPGPNWTIHSEGQTRSYC